jgi:hypothetical protein
MDRSVIFSTIYGNFGSNYAQRSTDGGTGMSTFLNSPQVAGLADDFYANIELYEDPNDTLSKDSIVYVNTNEDSSTIDQGDTISFESQTLRKEVKTTLKIDSLPYMDSVMVQDPVQSLFAFTGHKNEEFRVYLTRDALRLTKSTLTARNVLTLGSYDDDNNSIGNGALIPNAYAFSGDGNYLWIGMRDGTVYRIAGLDSAYSGSGFSTYVTEQEIISGSGKICTDISVDDNDPDHVVVTFGGYGSNQKVLQTYNATSPIPNFNNIWSAGNTNLTSNLAQIPVYSVLIERDDPNMILVGTEYGLWATDDAGSTWYHQDRDPLGHVPIFAIEQQDLSWDEGAKNPGHIYLGTHGRGFFKTDDLESIKPSDDLEAGTEEALSLDLFPNPATDETFVSFSEGTDQDLRIAIHDLQGRKVRDLGTRTIDGNERVRLDLSGMKEGIYVVRALGRDYDRSTRLVISR